MVTRFLAGDGPARQRLAPIASPSDPRYGDAVAVAGVNGDGHLDVLAGAHAPDDHIDILHGPQFTAGQTVSGVTGSRFAAADLNNDGLVDFVALAPDEQVKILVSQPKDGS